jgi:hypothetical protein
MTVETCKKAKHMKETYYVGNIKITLIKKKLRGFGSQANYADRATAACWRSSANFFVDRGCCVVSAMDSPGCSLGFVDRNITLIWALSLDLKNQISLKRNLFPGNVLCRKHCTCVFGTPMVSALFWFVYFMPSGYLLQISSVCMQYSQHIFLTVDIDHMGLNPCMQG